PALRAALGTRGGVILEVADVSKRFGALAALTRVSFAVEAGQVFSVIGPNGAGKSTLFNVVSGLHAPSAGMVRFCGEDITGMRPDETRDDTAFIRNVILEDCLSLLLITHDKLMLMGMTDRVARLLFGQMIAEATPEALRHHPLVIKTYLSAADG